MKNDQATKHESAGAIDRRAFIQSVAVGAGVTGASMLFRRATLATTFAADSPTATTKAGKVRGYTDNGINVFKGIRYGADTAGRRFMPPVPPEPWPEVRDALAYGPASPQQSRSSERTSEDCLFLNVWTPGLRDGRKRPVMFYIHGGAYANGSGSSRLYDGVRLCRRGDVVVVTINHRLNAFGYLYLARFGGPEFADSGNAGQLDLVLALQWVRDNIAEFGGDANKVMVFGQSGGGAKDRNVDGHAGSQRSVPSRGDDERPAGHCLRCAQRDTSRAHRSRRA